MINLIPFSFPEIIDSIRNDDKKGDSIRRYEELAGPIKDDVRENQFYQKHLARFKISALLNLGKVCFPDCMEDEKDEVKDLLIRLIVASHSSEYSFKKNGDEIQVNITVKSGDQSVTKSLDELWSFQVFRLFEVYVDEQISLANLELEEENKDEDEDGECSMLETSFIERDNVYNERVFELEIAFYREKKTLPVATSLSSPDRIDEWTRRIIRVRLSEWPDDLPDDDEMRSMMLKAPQMLRRWMMVDIFAPFEDIKRVLVDTCQNPQDIPDAIRIHRVRTEAMKSLSKDFEKGQIKKTLLRRTREWADTFGPISFADADSLAKSWGIPYSYIQLQEETVLVTPEDIRTIVEEEILGPEVFKQELSVVFYQHLQNMRPNKACSSAILSKPQDIDSFEAIDISSDPSTILPGSNKKLLRNNMLIQGTSGAGKTWSIRRMCERLGLPYIHIHCDRLVQEGIIGISIANHFMEKYKNEDKELLPYMVPIFDESDKLGDNHYGDAILNETLSLLDSPGEITFNTKPNGHGEDVTLSTSSMTFFFTGVFAGIKKNTKVGYNVAGSPKATDDCRCGQYSKEDYVRYGLSWELLGRIGRLITLPKPSKNLVMDYLSGKFSPIKKYSAILNELGVNLTLTEDGKEALAEKVSRGDTGYRMADNIINEIYQDYIFGKHTNPGNDTLIIDAEIVNSH